MTRDALAVSGVKGEIIKVTDMPTILSYDLLATHALVINEKVLSSGRLPAHAELITWLQTEDGLGLRTCILENQ